MDLRNRVVALLVGIGVLLLSILLAELMTIPVFFIDPAAVPIDPDNATRLGVMLVITLNFIGLGAGAAVYLYKTDRGWDWLDLHRPGKWDIVWMVGGTIITFIALIIVSILAFSIDADPPEQSTIMIIREDTVLIIFMLLTVWILNAPAEELLFRNVIQKRLYSAFSGVASVIIASLLFAGIHVLTFVLVGTSLIDVLVPILGIFIGSIVMGYAYWRTKNLWVPIVIHGLFNSIQISLLLLARILDIEEGDMAASAFYLLSVIG